jgi:hypothetical protein
MMHMHPLTLSAFIWGNNLAYHHGPLFHFYSVHHVPPFFLCPFMALSRSSHQTILESIRIHTPFAHPLHNTPPTLRIISSTESSCSRTALGPLREPTRYINENSNQPTNQVKVSNLDPASTGATLALLVFLSSPKFGKTICALIIRNGRRGNRVSPKASQ